MSCSPNSFSPAVHATAAAAAAAAAAAGGGGAMVTNGLVPSVSSAASISSLGRSDTGGGAAGGVTNYFPFPDAADAAVAAASCSPARRVSMDEQDVSGADNELFDSLLLATNGKEIWDRMNSPQKLAVALSIPSKFREFRTEKQELLLLVERLEEELEDSKTRYEDMKKRKEEYRRQSQSFDAILENQREAIKTANHQLRLAKETYEHFESDVHQLANGRRPPRRAFGIDTTTTGSTGAAAATVAGTGTAAATTTASAAATTTAAGTAARMGTEAASTTAGSIASGATSTANVGKRKRGETKSKSKSKFSNMTSNHCQATKDTMKRVRFNTRTMIRVCPTLATYSHEEIDACWNTPEEDTKSRNHIIDTIQSMRRGEINEHSDDKYCALGLELLYNSESLLAVTRARQAVIDAVLSEQERQWCDNVVDDVRIAVVAHRESMTSQHKAMMVAQGRSTSDATYGSTTETKCTTCTRT
mmetsp:Transcript_20603/g.44536  ORF Transcript_20603/g.44536 Transcript_20603/m.44536 type:complete len:475 (+) Transcript_20603:47-1471(+)